MKVLSVTLLLVGVVTARSGPYLPSGWRPAGPAFLLPQEIKDPSPVLRTSGVETSESDFLKNYGPPSFQLSEVSQDLTFQELPNQVTEQPFLLLRGKFLEEQVEKGEDDTAAIILTEEKYFTTETKTSVEETTTASLELDTRGRSLDINAEVEVEVEEELKDTTEIAIEKNEATTDKIIDESTQKTAEVNGEIVVNSDVREDAFIVKILDSEEDSAINSEVKSVTEITNETIADTLEITKENNQKKLLEETEYKVLDIKKDSENANSNIVLTKVEEKVENEVKAVENVENIEEKRVSLENEAKAQQVQVNNERTEIKSFADDHGNVETKGFLEYGPPGFTEYGPPGFKEYGPPKFTEYGPPKVSDVVRSPASNEVRRRRFSPKAKLIQRRQS